MHGRRQKTVDLHGGIFVAAKPGQRPVYAVGHPQAKMRDSMYQCPISAIPAICWDMLELWWTCRMFPGGGCLPVPGGLIDQPRIVRIAFPIFEHEMRKAEGVSQQDGPSMAAAMAVGTMLKALGFGGR